MFTVDDDFEVDEDFLEDAFECESWEKKKASLSEFKSRSSVASSSKPLQVQTNSQRTSKKGIGNNSDFLDLWNSNEEKLFFSKSPSKPSNPRNILDTARAISPIGVRSDVITRTSKHVRQRKFPGPAGLLPERTSNTSFIAAEEYLSNIENETENFSSFEDKQVFSQGTNKFFEEPGSAWRNMVDDLGPKGSQLISAINLSSVRVKQAKFGFKVPFLAVCVYNIDCSLPDPSLLLKDKIDEMHGTLHRDVWEDWKDEIIVGSVLVLRNTGVVSAGSSSRRFFLNITAKNIVTIYSPKMDCGIKITQIQSIQGLDTKEILQEWERLMTQTRHQHLGSESPQARPLYSSLQSTPTIGSPNFMNISPVTSFSSASLTTNCPFTPPIKPTFRAKAPLQKCISNNRPNLGHGLEGRRMQRPPINPQQNCSFRQSILPQRPSASTHSMAVEDKPAGQTHLPSNSLTPSYSAMNKVEDCEAPMKKPKISSTLKPATSSVFSVASPSDNSIIDSILDGIDTDLLFDDF